MTVQIKSKINSRKLTIVIPVYNALEETIGCVKSLLASDAGKCSIILMDDASLQSVPETLRKTFAKYKNVDVISNFHNRGYTANVALGLKESATQFVCLLNSDTLLPQSWAATMLAKLENNPSVAAVGPLSNAASYQSVPNVVDHLSGKFSDNQGIGYDPDEREWLSVLLSEIGQGIFVDVPVLNGFCTIFRCAALDAIGGFDTENFREGYGEENDLCIRLNAAGYRMEVCLGAFVHHQKSKSFGAERKEKLSKRGASRLASKFGSETVTRLTERMESSVPLEAVRKITSICLDINVRGAALKRSIDLGDSLILSDDSTPPLLKLRGGNRYKITASSVSCLVKFDQGMVLLSTREDGIEVSLPKGCELVIASKSSIGTCLLALSLLSCKRNICVGRWEPNVEAALPWPTKWHMPVEAERIMFDKIRYAI